MGDICLPLTAYSKELRLLSLDSADGALSCASAAIYANICVDLILRCAFFDSADRALSCASAAAYTCIADFMSHKAPPKNI